MAARHTAESCLTSATVPNPSEANAQSGSSRTIVVLLIVGQVAVLALLGFDVVRVMPTLLLTGLVVGYLSARAWRAVDAHERVRLGLFAAGSGAVVAGLAAPSTYEMARAVLILLVGWSVPLAVQGW